MIVRLVRVLRLAMPLGMMAVVVMAGVSRPDVLSQAGPEAATMERLRTLTGNDCFVKSTTTLSAPLNDLVAAGTVPAIEGGIPAVRKGDLGTAVEAWHGELMGVRDANAWIVTLVDGEWTGLELRGTTSEGGATAWVAVDRISADAGCDGFDDG